MTTNTRTEETDSRLNIAKETTKEWGPTMTGKLFGWKPQWRHAVLWAAPNKKFLKLDGGDEWTNVQYTVVRGGLSIRMPDGSEVLVGVPFPQVLPGILETIGFCGEAQAQAMAWNFAAQVQAAGGEVEVRAECHEIVYDLKARIAPPASAPIEASHHEDIRNA